ncbi:hypothetical protein RJ640_009893 [Escallonia rubra]|uniref:C2H2-type domain-containing protein n=1 Tax=Escallonia rubra TaxID=112253 RepID=A0AA88QY95_9ASTE|nr:hypothetical protein RJ640_009893 [Escallonia rubra]
MNMAAPSSATTFFGTREDDQNEIKQQQSSISTSSAAPPVAPQKKKRNLPGTPNPDAEVIALSPKTLMATNRFICEVCNKGFQREQNLQLHRRGHNLPWKLKQKTTKEVKRKVYLCPEPTCVHHDASRALGDLTGIKKHYSRKHGEKKYKCEKCSKKYAVQSDWKAHSKTCGTREYRCDCGTLFSRRDSFITHRAFCDALAQESAMHPSSLSTIGSHLFGSNHMNLGLSSQISQLHDQNHPSGNMLRLGSAGGVKYEHLIPPSHPSSFSQPMPSPAFLIPDSNQGYHQEQSHQHGLLSSKPFHGLMQLPDLQTSSSNTQSSAAASLFNLGFFSASNNGNGMTNSENTAANSNSTNHSGFLIPDQFSMGNQVGPGLSSLYNTSMEQESPAAPHMSATALLQKAAQMGSSTSNTSASLLKGLGNTSTTGSKPNFGRSFSGSCGGESLRPEMENENHLQGLMNSFANGDSSIFGRGTEQNNSFGGYSGSQNSTKFGNREEGKLQQNFSLSIGGTDRMTLDFLGVGGGIVRNMGGGFSQREQQHDGMDMSSLEPKINSAQARHVFADPKLQ